MLKSFILLSIVACALGAAIPEEGLLPQLDGRIVGGYATTISSFPWQVSLQRNGRHFCGGAIYSKKIIVTAAHCLQSVSEESLTIRAGSTYWNSGGVVVKVAAFKNHEGYNSETHHNDIAVIKLSSSLDMSSKIKAIELATTIPDNKTPAQVSGWGTVDGSSSIPDDLHFVNVKIIRKKKCASGTYSYGTNAIKSSMICAGSTGKDSCQGDSGGPLVSDGLLTGIVSWGYDCGRTGYPGVYTNVAKLRNWVINTSNTV